MICLHCRGPMTYNASGSGPYCVLECAGSTQAKVDSVNNMRERMEREFSWVDPRTLQEIMEKARL